MAAIILGRRIDKSRFSRRSGSRIVAGLWLKIFPTKNRHVSLKVTGYFPRVRETTAVSKSKTSRKERMIDLLIYG
jgi:hypothetical protein